jgi:hypothetical protein
VNLEVDGDASDLHITATNLSDKVFGILPGACGGVGVPITVRLFVSEEISEGAITLEVVNQ